MALRTDGGSSARAAVLPSARVQTLAQEHHSAHCCNPRDALRKRRRGVPGGPEEGGTRRSKSVPRNDLSRCNLCGTSVALERSTTLMPRRCGESGAVQQARATPQHADIMGLFGRNTMTVGLDIGSGLIKLVAISHSSGGPVLTKVAFTSVVNDAIVEGEVMDPGIVAEAIKGLLASAGIKAKKVVTAVGGRDVIIKKIAMDRMKEAEAREVIRWEAEQHVPFDMDNVELDFQILDPEGEGLQR